MQNATRLLAAVLMLLLVGTANAQETLDDPSWEITPADVDWLSAASHVRGGAINPVTGHLLIPSREGALSVQVLNPADGSEVGTLNVTDISGGTFALNKIAVTADGQIFASNMATDVQQLKIYYWADEDAAPVMIHEGSPSAHRYGDSFSLSGSGDDVVLYVSGAGGNVNIAVYEWDGDELGDARLIGIPANAAQTGLLKVTGEDSLWINNPVGGTLRKISLDDGTVGTTIGGDVVHTYLGELAEFHIDGRTYLAVGPGRHDEDAFLESRVVILDVTDVANIEVVAETTRWGTTDNRFAPGGFVTFDEANTMLIAGVTQNAIRAFSLDFLLPEPPPPVTVWEEAEWAIRPGDAPWMTGIDNYMRGGAYNPTTDHVLVASRYPSLGVHILHPANGQTIGQLDVTGISGGTFALSEIAVTEDGQIFGANLHVDGQGIKIYRWENEDAAPELLWDGNLDARAGDSFFAAGSGDDVRIYISGTFNDSITIFHYDGETATIARSITPEATVDRARMGIAEGATPATLWINGAGSALTEVDAEDGEILREVSLDVLGTSYGDIAYFELEGRSYILAGSTEGNTTDGYTNKFVVVDVTNDGGEFRAYETPFLGIHENAFFTGWAAFDTKRNNALIGGTNVIVAAFSMAEHDNEAPTASGILTPADGAEITIEGDGDTEFTATWEEATDPDDDTVLYTWQLSASPNFDDFIVDANVGTETSYTTDFETVASILDDAGVGFDGSITLYHRVVTSDGELTTTGSTSTVILTRGTLTNVEPGIGLPTEFALHGNYPNPFNPTTNIRFDLPQSADVRVEMYDILGRQVMTMQHSMQAGANQTISVDAAHLSSGTYLYRVVAEMQGATRVETGKMLLVK